MGAHRSIRVTTLGVILAPATSPRHEQAESTMPSRESCKLLRQGGRRDLIEVSS